MTQLKMKTIEKTTSHDQDHKDNFLILWPFFLSNQIKSNGNNRPLQSKLFLKPFYCIFMETQGRSDNFQSVANNFSDEQIRIWILFAKYIFYEYKCEYYSWHFVSRIWIRILFRKNIHKYIWIFENNQNPG